MVRRFFTLGGQRTEDRKKSYPLPFTLYAEQGSILIAVLWSLFFLSALAVALYAHIASQLNLVGRLRDRMYAYYVAEAGIKRAALEIRTDETQNYDALHEPWSDNEEAFKEMPLGQEGFFSVQYEVPEAPEDEKYRYGLMDEERRINVNTASGEILKRLLEGTGEVASQEAKDITDSMLDWIDEDDEPRENGAEEGYYANVQKAYSCPNVEFEALEELLFVKGMTAGIFDKVKGYLTVYGNGLINVNTAGKAVLRAMGMSEGLVEKILRFRRGSDDEEATRDDNVFEAAETAAGALNASVGLSQEELNELSGIVNAGLISVKSDYFRGESYGWREGGDFTKRILFVVDRRGQIKYWHEN
jgi:general secretion pathway protein K